MFLSLDASHKYLAVNLESGIVRAAGEGEGRGRGLRDMAALSGSELRDMAKALLLHLLLALALAGAGVAARNRTTQVHLYIYLLSVFVESTFLRRLVPLHLFLLYLPTKMNFVTTFPYFPS